VTAIVSAAPPKPSEVAAELRSLAERLAASSSPHGFSLGPHPAAPADPTWLAEMRSENGVTRTIALTALGPTLADWGKVEMVTCAWLLSQPIGPDGAIAFTWSDLARVFGNDRPQAHVADRLRGAIDLLTTPEIARLSLDLTDPSARARDRRVSVFAPGAIQRRGEGNGRVSRAYPSDDLGHWIRAGVLSSLSPSALLAAPSDLTRRLWLLLTALTADRQDPPTNEAVAVELDVDRLLVVLGSHDRRLDRARASVFSAIDYIAAADGRFTRSISSHGEGHVTIIRSHPLSDGV
jgi:hypothetical protein